MDAKTARLFCFGMTALLLVSPALLAQRHLGRKQALDAKYADAKSRPAAPPQHADATDPQPHVAGLPATKNETREYTPPDAAAGRFYVDVPLWLKTDRFDAPPAKAAFGSSRETDSPPASPQLVSLSESPGPN
jgi:hypothetical protein